MNKCLDCKKTINSRAKRCNSCAAKERIKCLGHTRGNLKDGRSLKKYYCKCGKKITWQTAIRGLKQCMSCALKEKIKMLGHGLHYTDGKSLKKYFCETCNKELSKSAYSRKNKLCGHCSQKQKKVSKETKKKISLGLGGTGIPYEFNEYPIEFYLIRKQILKRDNYICQICHRKGNTVHHIDYNKMNCKEDNLITTCLRCNFKINFNRNYWKKLLKKEINL